jgi:hypothetical protein
VVKAKRPRRRIVEFPGARGSTYTPQGDRTHQGGATDSVEENTWCGGSLRVLYRRVGAEGRWIKWGTVCERCGELWLQPSFTLEDILEGT